MTVSYCCPIQRKIIAAKRNKSPNIRNIDAHPDIGFVTQYIHNPVIKAIIPAINNNILIHLMKFIFWVIYNYYAVTTTCRCIGGVATTCVVGILTALEAGVDTTGCWPIS